MAKVILDTEIANLVVRAAAHTEMFDSAAERDCFIADVGTVVKTHLKPSEHEAAVAVARAINNGELWDTEEAYEAFLEALGETIARQFGAHLSCVDEPLQPEGEPAETRHALLFYPTEATAADGGVFARYDRDVSVAEWFESSGLAVPEAA